MGYGTGSSFSYTSAYFHIILIFTSSYSMLVEFPMQHRLVPKILINVVDQE